MLKSPVILLTAMLVLVLSSTAHARDPLEDPQPIALSGSLSVEDIEKIISGSLAEKNWGKEQTFDSEPKALIAALFIRSHKISMKIEYSTSAIHFSYHDSENMKYKEKKGVAYIHGKYNVWTQQLADQINTNLSAGKDYQYTAKASKPNENVNALPKVPFSEYSTFKLAATTLAKPYQAHEGNQSTRKNLDHNLGLTLKPKLGEWNKADQPGKTLLIKPRIEAVKFIGTAARFWVGGMAGRSWIYVSVNYVDEATGETVAQPELYRAAGTSNAFSLARRDYKMVEDMAADIALFTENNYSAAVGGGFKPSKALRDEVARIKAKAAAETEAAE